MATDRLIRLFTDENRVRVFAAVALGAGTPEEVARAAGVPAKETALALLKLREQGAVTATGGDGDEDGPRLVVAYDLFREYARADREKATRSAGTPGSGDENTDTDQLLRTFVRDGRLVRLPAQWTRKKRVLQHIAEQTFEPGVEYPERTVNEKLRAWCEEGETDHVTLRRYLVDLQHLRRSEGIYRRVA
ncbi:hypothetical protein SAMN06272735_3034 [Streptomyces sp. TLI_55]|uniref:DUF2087 domain-containing protein n=1 Tax=Streptomyces sp. TLI_55 TaxID=1938861 RepID=UPI000BC8D890|nr:DUF2087 domain-containing protein [Streptomyces sp. TLI_55]SNX58537.1 hypothetical protein SAMN06272735_3034 [Streptomyces sp. TLI_55]